MPVSDLGGPRVEPVPDLIFLLGVIRISVADIQRGKGKNKNSRGCQLTKALAFSFSLKSLKRNVTAWIC